MNDQSPVKIAEETLQFCSHDLHSCIHILVLRSSILMSNYQSQRLPYSRNSTVPGVRRSMSVYSTVHILHISENAIYHLLHTKPGSEYMAFTVSAWSTLQPLTYPAQDVLDVTDIGQYLHNIYLAFMCVTRYAFIVRNFQKHYGSSNAVWVADNMVINKWHPTKWHRIDPQGNDTRLKQKTSRNLLPMTGNSKSLAWQYL